MGMVYQGSAVFAAVLALSSLGVASQELSSEYYEPIDDVRVNGNTLFWNE